MAQAGRSGGYGNLIELRHANGITTRYGHLSAILVRPGMRVSQGQVIGRVGSTGLSTGPHLHYEFRVNGQPRDARRLDLGNGQPVAAADRPAFEMERGRLDGLLYPVSGSAARAVRQLIRCPPCGPARTPPAGRP